MGGVERAADVDGSEDGEDESLDEADADFKSGEDDEAGEGEDFQHGNQLERPDCDAEHSEADQQDVACEHVGEKSDGVAEGADEEGGNQLNRGDEDVHGLGDAFGESDHLEIGDRAVVLHAHHDEEEVGDDGQHERGAHTGVERHLEEGDHLKEVAHRYEAEEADEDGKVWLVACADAGLGDLVLNEADYALGEALDASGDKPGLATGDEEQNGGNGSGDESDESDLVEAVPAVAEEVGPLNDVLDRREMYLREDHAVFAVFALLASLLPCLLCLLSYCVCFLIMLSFCCFGSGRERGVGSFAGLETGEGQRG